MIITRELKTSKREEIVDITHIIEEELSKNKFKNGNFVVFIPHTTAGITINENADPDVKRDILTGLKSLNFESLNFLHSEGNSPAHLKATIVGNSANLIADNYKLVLGTWQGVYFCEFDGPRSRKFIISL
jgi:secondary thiamine-phosphate synthase enzyme